MVWWEYELCRSHGLASLSPCYNPNKHQWEILGWDVWQCNGLHQVIYILCRSQFLSQDKQGRKVMIVQMSCCLSSPWEEIMHISDKIFSRWFHCTHSLLSSTLVQSVWTAKNSMSNSKPVDNYYLLSTTRTIVEASLSGRWNCAFNF